MILFSAYFLYELLANSSSICKYLMQILLITTIHSLSKWKLHRLAFIAMSNILNLAMLKKKMFDKDVFFNVFDS